MHSLATRTYQKTTQATGGPRELEASLLLKAASRLQSVRDAWGERAHELEPALLFNRKLWTVLVTSATRPDNPLPRETKQNIANIGLFIFGRTLELQGKPEPDKIAALVSINRAIAEGLRG